jgi:ferrous iron transport protein B
MGRTAVRGKRVPLILELPPYRLPHVPTVGKMIWDRTYAFIREAGTIILFCTIVLWGLLSFPRSTDGEATQPDKAMVTAISSASDSEAHGPVASSYAGRMGRALEPVLEPLGFDWKIGIGLIGAFAAREVFVSTLAIVYGIEADDEDTTPLRDRVRSEKRADGSPFYTPLMGLSLLVFFSLACQCMSTLAVVRRETKTVKWPLFMFAYMTTAAYVASLLVYQGGKLLGF